MDCFKVKEGKVQETVGDPSVNPGTPDKSLKLVGGGPKGLSSHESEAGLKLSDRGDGTKSGVQPAKEVGGKTEKVASSDRNKSRGERKGRSRERTHESERKQAKEKRKIRERKDLKTKNTKPDKQVNLKEDKDKKRAEFTERKVLKLHRGPSSHESEAIRKLNVREDGAKSGVQDKDKKRPEFPERKVLKLHRGPSSHESEAILKLNVREGGAKRGVQDKDKKPKLLNTSRKEQDLNRKAAKEDPQRGTKRSLSSMIGNSLPPKKREQPLFPPRFQSEFMKLVFRDTEPDYIASLHFQPKKQKKSSNETNPTLAERPTVFAKPSAPAPYGKKRKLGQDASKGIPSSESHAPKKVKLDLNQEKKAPRKKFVPTRLHLERLPDNRIGLIGLQTSMPRAIKEVGAKKRARSRSRDSAYDSDCFGNGQKKARSDSPSRKAMEKAKFEKARELAKKIDEIREIYKSDFNSKNMEIRQRAVAMYFIDHLGFRIGNEKDEESAKTVGCCGLLVKHIKLLDSEDGSKYVVVFNYAPEDSSSIQVQVPVHKQVFKSLKIFVKEKKAGDAVFDWLEESSFKKHLEGLMDGLAANLFRVSNASGSFKTRLDEGTPKDGILAEKIAAYNKAKRAVVSHLSKQPGLKSHEEAMSDNETDTGKTKEPALDTSKVDYLDPKVTADWCKKYGVQMPKAYKKPDFEQPKLRWATDISEDYTSFRFD